MTTGKFAAPGTPQPRSGDEIMVCGQLFHTGAPVVLWTDPGGYDAYRTDRRFAPFDKASWEATNEELLTAATTRSATRPTTRPTAGTRASTLPVDRRRGTNGLESPNRYNM